MNGRITPLRTAAIALAIGAVVVVLRLQTFDWNPTGFVWAGDHLAERSEAPENLIIRPDSAGFDGIAYYRLALDPFTREKKDFGLYLDHTAFRHQRILYPLVVWAATGGHPVAAAWVLVGVNLAGFAVIAFVGARLAATSARAPWWGLVFAANPAYALALGLDTAEVVAGALFLAAMLALRRARWPLATVMMVLAMFARETTLILPAGIAALVVLRVRERPPWRTAAIPLAAFVAWQAVLAWWWGDLALGTGAGLDIGAPLAGIVRAGRAWIPPDQALDGLHLAFVFAVLAFAFTLARSVARGAGPAHERAAIVLSLALLAMTSAAIWFHHWGFLRATAEVYALGVGVLLADARAPVHRLVLAPAIAASIWINMVLFP